MLQDQNMPLGAQGNTTIEPIAKNLTRRVFLGTLATVAAASGSPLSAHEQPPFELPQDYLPTVVELDAWLPTGSIHVFPDQFRLYLMLPGRQSLRYTVGVGKPGLYHAGEFTVGAKREWPSWRPTPDMIERDPETYAQHAGGMPGGLDNPLGARALYLFDAAGHDTYLRIHGTDKPRTIGTAVSNGCARLTNDHVIDLYDRVEIGTVVYLHRQAAA
jgi:lipoprotein-anchoring transpeptidase ErfK/SrfK